jgi:hypothetical protein
MPSIEVYRDRQKLFSRLVDDRAWESLTNEFPRSIIAWQKRLEAVSDKHETIAILKLATSCCRKSPHLWDQLLNVCEDDVEVYSEAMEAIGLIWTAESIVEKIARVLESHQGLVERRRDWEQGLINVKQQFESIVFPENSSSFLLPIDSAKEYIECLSEWAEEQEDVFQRLVFVYNDDLVSWRMYCDWLHARDRKEDLMDVLDTACTKYVSYNPNMWAMAAEYAQLVKEDVATEWSRQALSRNVEYLECASLEVIASILPEEEWSLIFPEYSSRGMFGCYLRYVKNNDQSFLGKLIEIFKDRDNVDLSDADVSLMCYALSMLGFEHGLRIDRILKHNAHKILPMMRDGAPTKDHVMAMIEGTTTAPLPVAKAPPKPVVHYHDHNVPRRPLPGYTPGWMAEEYAKKHKI